METLSLNEMTVLTLPCSECGLSRTIAIEQAVLAVIPAPGPTRQEVLVEVTATVLAGCARCM